ncbi:MAG: hypothetical protein O2871_01685 [bacterium]|nr:hypothetical protein [bacterium]
MASPVYRVFLSPNFPANLGDKYAWLNIAKTPIKLKVRPNPLASSVNPFSIKRMIIVVYAENIIPGVNV